MVLPKTTAVLFSHLCVQGQHIFSLKGPEGIFFFYSKETSKSFKLRLLVQSLLVNISQHGIVRALEDPGMDVPQEGATAEVPVQLPDPYCVLPG